VRGGGVLDTAPILTLALRDGVRLGCDCLRVLNVRGGADVRRPQGRGDASGAAGRRLATAAFLDRGSCPAHGSAGVQGGPGLGSARGKRKGRVGRL
jgi:hypothetical protein